MGIPSAFLTEVENIEFAKVLSMQNSRFIRDIVSEQITFGNGYTELLRKLYVKKYGSPSKEKEEHYRFLDVETIEVRFPPPASLNMTNLNDQVSNLNTLLDALVEIIDVPSEDKDAAGPIFRRMMYKKYIPNLSWDEIDDIVGKVKKDITVQKIKAKFKDDSAGDDADAPPDDSASDDV